MIIPSDIIRRKRDGETLSAPEIQSLVDMALTGDISDEQLSALFMAIYFRGLTDQETSALTAAMTASGETLSWDSLPGPTADKHSTGGVGDKISLMLAPVVAACDVFVPMMAGRGLGHTGGTIDKLESIEGYRAELDSDEFRRVVSEVGCAIVGQTPSIAPADKRFYAIRDTTATVETIPLIVASILSKKFAEGAASLTFDVKTGTGAFMREHAQATELARRLVEVSEANDRRAVALVTSMDAPLGEAVGNALEVAESVRVLRGEAKGDLRALTLALAAEMIASVTDDSIETAHARAEAAIDSGSAYERFVHMVSAQGGRTEVIEDLNRLPKAAVRRDLTSPRAGYLAGVDGRAVGLVALSLGGGRRKRGDVIDPAVGLEWRPRIGDFVEKGDVIATVHARSDSDATGADEGVLGALEWSEEPVKSNPIVLERVVRS